jgi:hypothetical protein
MSGCWQIGRTDQGEEKQVNKEVTFWAATKAGWMAAKGKPAKVLGVSVVVHPSFGMDNYGLWSVSHPDIGLKFPQEGITPEEALSLARVSARHRVKTHGFPWDGRKTVSQARSQILAMSLPRKPRKEPAI